MRALIWLLYKRWHSTEIKISRISQSTTRRNFRNVSGIRQHLSLIIIIIPSKCFPISDWLIKVDSCWPNLEQTLSHMYYTNDTKSFVILNQWRQNDVKSAACCRLLNCWLRKPGHKVTYFIFGAQKNKERNGETPLWEIFWMNNKAIIEFVFWWIWRIQHI